MQIKQFLTTIIQWGSTSRVDAHLHAKLHVKLSYRRNLSDRFKLHYTFRFRLLEIIDVIFVKQTFAANES